MDALNRGRVELTRLPQIKARCTSVTSCACVKCAACDAARTRWCATPSYRYYFLDSADHIADFHLIQCETDSQAQVRADRLLAACGYPSIEVWDCDRRVYRARKTDIGGGAS